MGVGLAPSRLIRCLGVGLVLGACQKGNPLDRPEGDGITEIEHCGAITGEATWSADYGHRITCDVVVTGSLTLEPGVQVVAELGTALRIEEGTLQAVGSSSEPLLLASAQPFPLEGDWVGLVGQDASVDLAHLTVRHAGSEGALVWLDGGAASVSNVVLSNSTQRGLYADGTEFSVIEELEVAYAEEPLSIPWPAAAVLSGIYLDQVDGAAVRLLGESLDSSVGLAPIDVPYLCEGVSVGDGGVLWMDGGAMLATTGDIDVGGGGSIVMRGSFDATAALLGWEGAEFTVTIDAGATMADFRWASIVGGGVVSAIPDLSFRYSEINGAPGTALEITGGVDTGVISQLTDCSFAGDGYGLVVSPSVLPWVGENDYSGSSWDGVVLQGGDLVEDTSLGSETSPDLLVLEEIRVLAGTLSATGPGTWHFDDGGGLVVDGGSLNASDLTFTHVGETPGGWEGIVVIDAGQRTFIERCEVAFGGAWDGANVTLEDDASVRQSTLRDSAGWGILVGHGADADLLGNTYDGNAQGDVGP